MSEVNINQHYTSNLKAERPKRTVASAPDNLPSFNLCKDEDLNKKMRVLNNDIYQDSKHEKNKSAKTFWKCFGGLAVLVMGIRFFRSR
ncbi:MAG: hypothetical protein NC408_10035 [Candidatus Gastranaerophilales bacterium]|nr:hypothetical protein [Candidatus Gastranaerophilales bacterium]